MAKTTLAAQPVQGFIGADGTARKGQGDKPQKARLVAVNERGHRIGETHHWAKLTQVQVDEIRDRYEAGRDGEGPKVGYQTLAKAYGVSKSTIRQVVNYTRWNQWADKWVRR